MPKKLEGRRAVMAEFAEAAAKRGEHFFYIRIQEPLNPKARASKYEDTLKDALGELGRVTGGGSQLNEGNTIEYCGIDVVVADRHHGLKLIRKIMKSCGAPAGTIIEEYLPLFREMLLKPKANE